MKNSIMEPLILSFKEKPLNQSIDYSIVEYSEKINLSVLKNNGEPAVKYMNLSTETFTKTDGESADSDRNFSNDRLNILLDTSTKTFTGGEQSDTDFNTTQKLRMLLDTTTITESVEGTDKDR